MKRPQFVHANVLYGDGVLFNLYDGPAASAAQRASCSSRFRRFYEKTPIGSKFLVAFARGLARSFRVSPSVPG